MNDTEKLLRECNSGIKMGVDTIDHVLPYVKSHKMKESLNACKDKHAVLGSETHKALEEANIDALIIYQSCFSVKRSQGSKQGQNQRFSGKNAVHYLFKHSYFCFFESCNLGCITLQIVICNFYLLIFH